VITGQASLSVEGQRTHNMVLLPYGLKKLRSTIYLYHQQGVGKAMVYQMPILPATRFPLKTFSAHQSIFSP
jgi:hypothetical protein